LLNDSILALGSSDLRALAMALRTGRLAPPFAASSVQRVVRSVAADDLVKCLLEMAESGIPPAGLAMSLELLASGIDLRPPLEDLVDLVTTGPEAPGVTNRDTGVVVRDLFAGAERSVLVAGYAVHQGRRVFQALAQRMVERPDLKVRMFLEIQRPVGDTSAPEEIIARFSRRFRAKEWPSGERLPEVFYDPRSLEIQPDKRTALHAKCVVVDGCDVFVSSANFTEAAQQRNIEIGLLLRSPIIAQRLARYFEALVESGRLERL
jgi:phosphatidylserine/phosphatidylglycerophosphate/cardiolipin synthase-like enzyme